MNMPHRYAGRLALLLATALLLSSPVTSSAADKERDDCARNLQTIWNAIQAARAKNKDLPAYLSQLIPDFVNSPNVLICPVTRRTGEIKNRGLSDPGVSTSYLYEFSSHKVPGLGPKQEMTLRDWRQLQMGRVGSIVPILRCLHHDRVLNMSFDGKVYETAGDWEAELGNVVDPEMLAPAAMLAQVEHFLTGIRATRIQTVDLSKYYNLKLTDPLHDPSPDGPSLKNFPTGRNKFRGIPFEVSGLIHLHGTGLVNIFPGKYPTNVADIAIGQRAEKVHFLLSAGYNQAPGQKVGTFKVNYDDGQSAEIVLNYDLNIRDWWQPFPEGNTTLQVAWSGAIGRGNGGQPQNGIVYLFSWDNPRVQAGIKAIDFTSALNSTAPFLLGISVEAP